MFRRNQRVDCACIRAKAPLQSGARNPEASSRFAHRQAAHDGELLVGNSRFGPSEPGPCALARARPATTRSIRARSNSAIMASRCACKRPPGVVQSRPSRTDMNPTPSACRSSSRMTRCFNDLPILSRDQQTTTSNRRRRGSRISRSRAGRRSFAPLLGQNLQKSVRRRIAPDREDTSSDGTSAPLPSSLLDSLGESGRMGHP